METKIVRRYVHGQEDELSDLWPPDAPQQDSYHYSLYEVAIDLEVEMATGFTRIVAVDGVPLSELGDFR